VAATGTKDSSVDVAGDSAIESGAAAVLVATRCEVAEARTAEAEVPDLADPSREWAGVNARLTAAGGRTDFVLPVAAVSTRNTGTAAARSDSSEDTAGIREAE